LVNGLRADSGKAGRRSGWTFLTVQPVKQARLRTGIEMASVARQVIAQLNARAASAVGALLTLLLGAVLSMKMRGRLPLVVFLNSFLLAIAAVIIIRSGENVTGYRSLSFAVGVAVIWSGDLLLLLAVALNYWKLARH
jgi:hypothetical protein